MHELKKKTRNQILKKSKNKYLKKSLCNWKDEEENKASIKQCPFLSETSIAPIFTETCFDKLRCDVRLEKGEKN